MQKRLLQKYDGKKQKWLHNIIEITIILLLLNLLFHFVIGLSFVKGSSMYPTLQNNDIVFYTRIIPEYKRGDILSVRMPSGEYYVKRVIAAGGDTVDIKNGKVYVNGDILKELYVKGETETKIGGVEFPYTVGSGKIFVMGDNRGKSMDSRDFGAVTRGQIKGKILLKRGLTPMLTVFRIF